MQIRWGESKGEEFYLAAMNDSQHVSFMLSTWATTREMGNIKYRRVKDELKTFQYG